MPHLSRNKLARKTEESLVNNLNLVLTNIAKSEDMLSFVTTLLTPTEKLMVAKRLAIIILVEEDLPDSIIADSLNVTRITVAKMRYFYEAHGEGFRIAIKALEKQKQLDAFKKLLLSLAKYSIRATGGRISTPRV